MSKEYIEEEIEDEIMEDEEVKESKIKSIASKAKSKINFRKVAKTVAVGAGLVAAYALGTKTGSKHSGSDCDFTIELGPDDTDVVE